MTEATVREYAHVYKDAEKLEGSLEVRKKVGSTSDFQQLVAAEVIAGRRVECSWAAINAT